MIIKLILTACSRVSSDKCYSCTDEDLSSATILEQCNDPDTAENCNFVNSHVSMHPFKCSLAMYPDSSKYVTLYQTESMRRRLLKWVEILCASGIQVVKFLGFGPLAHFWLLGRVVYILPRNLLATFVTWLLPHVESNDYFYNPLIVLGEQLTSWHKKNLSLKLSFHFSVMPLCGDSAAQSCHNHSLLNTPTLLPTQLAWGSVFF